MRQAHTYDCGPSSLLSVLAFYGAGGDINLTQLSKKTRATYEYGAHERDLARVARHYGLNVRMKHNMSFKELRDYVRRGVPVIVGYQAWAPSGTTWKDYQRGPHYSVVIGVDDENVWLMDPSSDLGKRGFIPIQEFKERWHWIADSGKVAQHFGMAITSKSGPMLRSHSDGVLRVE